MRSIMIALIFVTLAGCAAVPWNPQNNAGLTNVHMEGCGADEGIDGQMFCDIAVIDGKEKANVKVVVAKGDDGTFKASYEATGVAAFEGQALRAEVEAAVAAAIRQALPEIAKALIQSTAPVTP
jgi:hypothetical protein